MSSLRILHLASFSGNIGDNANHMGFRPWFAKQVGREVAWSNCEIREFYWKERAFDTDFVALANSYDALVIGGGNYFELWEHPLRYLRKILIKLEHQYFSMHWESTQDKVFLKGLDKILPVFLPSYCPLTNIW